MRSRGSVLYFILVYLVIMGIGRKIIYLCFFFCLSFLLLSRARREAFCFQLFSLEVISLVEIQPVHFPGVFPLHRQHELHHLAGLHPPVDQHEDVFRDDEPEIREF